MKSIQLFILFSLEEDIENDEQMFVFKVLSYNILAQDLLELHPDIYRQHEPSSLPWTKRKPLIVKEIVNSEAHVNIILLTLNNINIY